MSEKLLIRYVSVLSKKTEQHIGNIYMENFNVKDGKIKFLVDVKTDPLMLLGYTVTPKTVDFIQKFLIKDIIFNFDKYIYYIEASPR